MKTLDEVITLMEGVGFIDWGVDALRYLQNYRDAKAWIDLEKKNYAEAVRNCEKAEAKYTMMVLDLNMNPPLTWDELKTMEGKPVWVVVDEKERWRIIREVTNEHLMLESGLPLHKCWMNHPDGWQAYRKERYEDLG